MKALVLMKTHKSIDFLQPSWVCRECGHQWGLWWQEGQYKGPVKHCATLHEGKCDVCGNKKSVTEPRDYGYLKEGWHEDLPDKTKII